MIETEATFQTWVIDRAHAHGWRCAHFRPAKTDKGWRTAVAADGAGFPDLVLTRDRVLFVELKANAGRLSPEQDAWLAALTLAGAEIYVWRPRNRPEIEQLLAP